MLSSFDIFLIALSFVIMLLGFESRRQMWWQGRKASGIEKGQSGGFFIVLKYLLSHQKIMEDRTKGWLHLFVFWGVLLPLLVVVIAQFKITLPIPAARALSLLLDIVGLCAVVSLGILIFNRWHNNGGSVSNRSSAHLWILLAIMLTGFLTEGTRLSIVPAESVWSPFGFVFSTVLPDSPVLLQIFTRTHFILVLIFIACLPFSMMRHVVAAFLNVYYQCGAEKETVTVLPLEADHFGAGRTEDFTWKQLLAVDACVDCGRCVQNCPASISGKTLSPQKTIVQKIKERMEKDYRRNGNPNKSDLPIQDTDKWSCTTCLACATVCPVLVGPVEKLIALRRYSVLMESNFPTEYKQVFKNLEIFGDNLGKGPLMREEWISGLNIKKLYEDNMAVEILFWTGCQGGLDERNRKTTLAAAEIMNKAGVRFGILGKEELCCGDPALRMGNEYLFQKLATKNIDTLKRYGIKKMVTFCPHCFNTFKREYPQLGADFEVVYFVDFIKTLIIQGSLQIATKMDERFTFHDPCYLGRYHSGYHGPRTVLNRILDSEIKEMPRSGEKSFCCGAGGGNFWRGKASGRRIEEMRIEEALEVKTDGIVTACPFCDIMFESAVKQKGMEYSFAVRNIVGLVNQATVGATVDDEDHSNEAQ